MEDSTASLTPIAHTRTSSRAPSARRQETEDSEKAGRVWAREPEEDAWAPCILTLDGGGIRGYSSLIIMKALMHEVWLWEQKLDAEEGGGIGLGRSGSPDAADVRNVPSNTVHPVGMGLDVQATAGAPSTESPRSGDDPEPSRALYATSTSPTLPENDTTIDPAIRHVHHDQLTTKTTVAKALSEEELLPCHYFDFMYGTSTGGLIATILGRLRMTVTEGLDLYRKVGDDLFGRKRSNIPLMTKYHHEPLERAVRDIVASRCHDHDPCDGNDMHPWDSEHLPDTLTRPIPFEIDAPRVCQSCCLTATANENISEAYLLRSYPHYYTAAAPNWITRYNEGADPLPIWLVTRATSAAPFYFEMVRAAVNNEPRSFKDGGIRENNPSGAALSEFHALYEGRVDVPALMLSIGTGRPNQKADGFATDSAGSIPHPLARLPLVRKFLEKRAIIQNLLIKYTEGEKQHHQMREHAHGEHTWYKRLNVSAGLESTALDEWVPGDWHGRPDTPGGKTLTYMETVTEKYLRREFDEAVDSYAPPAVMLTQAAEKLVRQRRAREKLGGKRWQVFIGREFPPEEEDEDDERQRQRQRQRVDGAAG